MNSDILSWSHIIVFNNFKYNRNYINFVMSMFWLKHACKEIQIFRKAYKPGGTYQTKVALLP